MTVSSISFRNISVNQDKLITFSVPVTSRLRPLLQETSVCLPHTLGPYSLVQASVDAYIRGSHLLHGELADLLESTRCPPLEGPDRIEQEATLITCTGLSEVDKITFVRASNVYFSKKYNNGSPCEKDPYCSSKISIQQWTTLHSTSCLSTYDDIGKKNSHNVA